MPFTENSSKDDTGRSVRRAEIAKTWSFDAAHHLPSHAGKCRNPHGHTYTVEAVVEGEVKQPRGESDDGMVVDFGTLSAIWKEHLEPRLDHQDLNESIGADGCWPTTAENIAHWIALTFRSRGAPVSRLSVWETPSGRATVYYGTDDV
ncbi:6-carboxytetrahydropterin synthase QueD [Kribbella sp. NPDC058245]|uniref:6-carboxytetrahydropterin synthase QueD n=1 Tax=Kribbella sp. NPDC058245 TaxID=3346399 RepID=UPI0036E28607